MRDVREVVDEEKITEILEDTKNPSETEVRCVLRKASEKEGLTLREASVLLNTEDSGLIGEMFKTSGKIKQDIYGKRLVFFAPLYLSNYCVNDCAYCGFHSRNPSPRKRLTRSEVAEQVRILVDKGHKRLLVECGEHPQNSIDYVVDCIKTVYGTKTDKGEIRRVNVNIAATDVEDYKKLKAAGIGTYQLFQETYHQATYDKLHRGPKRNFKRQLFAHDCAMQAEVDDVGLGVLFGLYDYKFDVLGLLSHSQYLERVFNVGPHTISVPRVQPAPTVNLDKTNHVSEEQFLKIISILRMAIPYTGMIITTRERPEIRARAFGIGISQTSAASSTIPGGYSDGKGLQQFCVQDERSVDENIATVLEQGFLPSFCTACYRVGRTGERIMELIKAGKIHELCGPNAILTFEEYLKDFASRDVREMGERAIASYIEQIPNEQLRRETIARLTRIEQGQRDLYF